MDSGNGLIWKIGIMVKELCNFPPLPSVACVGGNFNSVRKKMREEGRKVMKS